MANTLDELTSFVATAASLTAGTSLFSGRLPDAPDAATAILEYSGRPTQQVFGAGVVAELPRIQVRCRGVRDDYTTPRTLLETIYRALIGVRNQNLGTNSTHYLCVNALQAPFLLERDDNDRPVLACNFEVLKALSL